MRHVYIIGSKSIGMYGGFETFVKKLIECHKSDKEIKYHIACKANGNGYMDVSQLNEITTINNSEFEYCNAHCFLIKIPSKIGAAQAIYYDLKAFKWCCNHIEKNHIEYPVIYILASRIGPFEKKYVQRIHKAGGKIAQNPDGHEDWRGKWNYFIRRYWKYSEMLMIKNCDLVICDSVNIEKYIQSEYSDFSPRTTFIAYGSDIKASGLSDNDPKYVDWMKKHGLNAGHFYISVGRFVPENNFEVMIREFMKSKTDKDFAIITTDNPKFLRKLNQKLHFSQDKRIKFVGTVYDQELLKKIRETAYGYLHGHSVGGTNPSLLEALSSTNLNLLYDVGFNKEVAESTAKYWTFENGNLAALINEVDCMDENEILGLGNSAKKRIEKAYSWNFIAAEYKKVFVETFA